MKPAAIDEVLRVLQGGERILVYAASSQVMKGTWRHERKGEKE